MDFFLLLFRTFVKDSERFSTIKNSENSEKSIYFGVIGILSSILGVAICLASVFGGLLLIENASSNSNILAAIFFIIVGATVALGGVVGLFMSAIRGMIASIYQIRLPRKTIGVVALIINLAIIITIIGLIWIKYLS